MTSRYLHDVQPTNSQGQNSSTTIYAPPLPRKHSTFPLLHCSYLFLVSSITFQLLFVSLAFAMTTNEIVTRELKKPITVAEYLFHRLHEVGVRSVHGVPGELPTTSLASCSPSNLVALL